MHFKLIIALVEDEQTDRVMKLAREAGATGATVINGARGEGMEAKKTFFGMNLTSQRDILMFLVEEHLARTILETIHDMGKLSDEGVGIAFQLDVEDAVGVAHQAEKLQSELEARL